MQSAERTRRRDARDLLLVAPNWLGDLVMSTVLLERLAAMRRCHGVPRTIVLAARRPWLSLLERDPRADHLLAIDRPGRHAGWRGMWRLARDWRESGCGAVLLLPPSLRVAAVAVLAAIPRRIGQRGDGRSWLLTTPLPRPPRGAVHYTEEVLSLGRAWALELGLPWGESEGAPILPSLPACDAVSSDQRLAGQPPVWALAPGATFGEAKAWPVVHVAAIVDHAVAHERVRVLLLGDEAARGTAARVRAASRSPWREELIGGPGAVDLTGRTDLRAVVSLLRGCTLFIGNDSGLMHLAAALGVPTVGIFGSSNPAWTGPRGRRAAVVTAEGFSCHPCYLRRCPREVFCLDTVTPEFVLAAAIRLLAADRKDAEN